MRTQPIYTGGFVRPTIFHGPLPRMTPQPLHVTMTIRKRIRARERRIAQVVEMQDALEDLELESQFEEGLLGPNAEGVFSPRSVFKEWGKSYHNYYHFT